MKQQTQNEEVEPIEYFAPRNFAFKFNYLESQDPNFAESLVDDIKNKEEK